MPQPSQVLQIGGILCSVLCCAAGLAVLLGMLCCWHAVLLGMLRCWACCAVCCRDDLFTSMLPKYHDILRHQADLDILIFSGDVDGIVPVIGTRRWLASLELPIIKEWRPWYSQTGKLPCTLWSSTHRPCNDVKDHAFLGNMCKVFLLIGQ